MNTIFGSVQIWEVTMDINNPNLMTEKGDAYYHIVPVSEDSGAYVYRSFTCDFKTNLYQDNSRGMTTTIPAMQSQNMNDDAFVPDDAD